MKLQHNPVVRNAACFLFAAALLSGCDSKKAEPQTPASKADVVAKLAKADAVDGKVDKVVSKCAACDLGMDGSPAIVLKVHDYSLHFCSAGCKEGYESDPDKAIMAMTIPN